MFETAHVTMAGEVRNWFFCTCIAFFNLPLPTKRTSATRRFCSACFYYIKITLSLSSNAAACNKSKLFKYSVTVEITAAREESRDVELYFMKWTQTFSDQQNLSVNSQSQC
jgi:hypothetical protein